MVTMRILFVHQNFPGQFRHLAPALAARGHEVVGMTMNDLPPLPGVGLVRARAAHGSSARHPWAGPVEAMAIRAEAGLRAALSLDERGFAPDAIMAHSGWGDSTLLKEVWPAARLGLYCESFLPPRGVAPFDPEFEQPDHPAAVRGSQVLKSIPQFLAMHMANAGYSPMAFQKGSFPAWFQPRISVIHDGIDTDRAARRPDAEVRFGNGKRLTAADEVITYIARHLEPARGFNIFMRALPELLRARPQAHVIIVGGDGVSYGRPPPEGQGCWREVFLREIGDRIDPARVHFVGQLGYSTFLDVLSVARLRIYLTHPTVVSWSVLETMAAGCAVLASDVAPLGELITDGETGKLFPYFDRDALIAGAIALLDDAGLRARIATKARRHIVEHYDLKSVCLPRQFEWIDRLAACEPLPPVMAG